MTLQDIELYSKFTDFYNEYVEPNKEYYIHIARIYGDVGYTFIPKISEDITIKQYNSIADSYTTFIYLNPDNGDHIAMYKVKEFDWIVNLSNELSIYIDYNCEIDYNSIQNKKIKSFNIPEFKKAFYDYTKAILDDNTYFIYNNYIQLIAFNNLVKYLQERIYKNADTKKSLSNSISIIGFINNFFSEKFKKVIELASIKEE